jgi:hypothetical protein
VAVDAGPWSVARIPGILFWLDGSKGVTVQGSLVSAWLDQSGAKNDALQPNASLQPKLASNFLAGHAAIEFSSAATTYLDVPTPTQPFTADFFVELLFESGAADVGDLFSAGNPVGDNAQVHLAPPNVSATISIGANSKAVANVPYTSGVPHLVIFRRTGSKLELTVDGTGASIADAPTGALPALFRVGGAFTGHLVEVVAVNASVGDPDRTALEAYLKSKYAL